MTFTNPKLFIIVEKLLEMGMYLHIGLIPCEGIVCPTGMHNIVPHKFRKYVPTYDNCLTPFLFFYDHAAQTHFYLGYKAFPTQIFTSNQRKMYKAIVYKDFNQIEKLLDSGFDINTTIIPEFGFSPLAMASALNLVEVVHYLTVRGANFEHKNGPFEKTALHIAVESGNELVTKFLLNNGADIEAKDKFGLSVYEKSEFRGNYKFKKIFNHFKGKKIEKQMIDYDSFRYIREIEIDNLEEFNEKEFKSLYFKPSNCVERSHVYSHNKINDDFKIDVDIFGVSFTNLFEFKKINNFSV